MSVAMEMPKPTAHHQKLSAFAGTWIGEEKVHPSPFDPEGGPANGTMTARIELDGFFVLLDYLQKRNDKVSYRGHGVFGYDTARERYTMYWFDTIGIDPGGPALGRLENDTFTFEMSSPMGFHRYSFRFTDEVHQMRIENSRDGNSWTIFLEGTYHRS
jgi:hypothetical protein